jgi:hypothetical protein
MKKPKSKTKPTDSHAADAPTTEQLATVAAILAIARNTSEKPDMLTFDAMELWLSAQKRKLNHSDFWQSYEMGVLNPTHEQLATLAVNLARKISDNPKNLVNAALEIWYEAGFKLEYDHFDAEINLVHLDLFTGKDLGADGKVLRDDFFKKVLPPSKRSRSYEVGRIGRAFIHSLFCAQFKEDQADEKFESFYAKWNAGHITDANKLAQNQFQCWYRQYIKESRRAAGLNSAANRAAEREAAKAAEKKLKKKL